MNTEALDEYRRRVAAIPPHVQGRDRERAVAVAYQRFLDRLAREARVNDLTSTGGWA